MTKNKRVNGEKAVAFMGEPASGDINNFDRKPYPAFEIRDTLSDIPYVDDTSWGVKVDEKLGVIHLRPEHIRDNYTFEYKGQKYVVNKYASNFDISITC